MTRTDARELLMQMLYSMKIQEDYSKEAKETFVSHAVPLGDQQDYFNKMYDVITEHLQDIDDIYSAQDTKWKINRLSNVDLSIFRIAIAEIEYIDEIPDKVSINEAVDMAKKFSDEKSAKFINGVLGKIAKDL